VPENEYVPHDREMSMRPVGNWNGSAYSAVDVTFRDR
jgi:hypothetical protein